MTCSRDGVCCKSGSLKMCSNGIVAGLELMFYRLGGLVARNPRKTIGLCVFLCFAMGAGLMKWNEEKDYRKLWIPRGSRINDEYEWIATNFPESVRFESLIVEDNNVLSSKSINAMFDLYERINDLQTMNGENLTGLCVKAGPLCRVNSILELWYYDENVIRNLTDEAILKKVNQEHITSPLYNNEIFLEKMLGLIQRNKRGEIIGAKATTMLLYLERLNTTEATAREWETLLINMVTKTEHPGLQNVYIYSTRTFDDEAMGTMYRDLTLLLSGFGLVFIYLSVTLSQFSLVHHKLFLAAAGLLSIGMTYIFTFGFGFLTGIMFGPIHQIMPFMILGIGVDDIFVIMEALNYLADVEKNLPVDRRIAHTMKHAGVSITVTSVTDIVAFAIGSSTVIPALSTFCVYASISVFVLYVLQSTFFVACLTLDEQRKDARYNACFLCYKHSDTYKPNQHYTFSVQRKFMKNVCGPTLTKTPVKVLVILATISLTVFNVWNFSKLEHEFDPNIYVSADSYSKKFVKADRKFFPDDGAFVQLYCGEMDYSGNINKFMELYETIQQQDTVQSGTVDFWLVSYQRWLKSTPYSLVGPTYKTRDISHESTGTTTSISNPSNNIVPQTTLSPYKVSESMHVGVDVAHSSKDSIEDSVQLSLNNTDGFITSLGQFLHTQQGRVYLASLKLDNWTAPSTIKASMLTFRHVKCGSSRCSINAMKEMRSLVDSYTFNGGGTCFIYSDPQYLQNETNGILKEELYRNLALAAVAVFIVTLILITNLWTSFLVFISVLLTVIDVAGTMKVLGISVDTASSVILILCFGLAVDFSAHIGHSFMIVNGDLNGRLKKTLVSMGPAVFSGGFSTFLAFSLLAGSESYGFMLFFQIFTSVVVFGLFHGLTFLPVILSIVGPPPYESQILTTSEKDKDVSSAMLQNGNGHKKDDPDPRVIEYEMTVIPNGKLAHSESNGCHDEDPKQNIHGDNSRHSGSYYERLSTGSWMQIPHSEPV